MERNCTGLCYPLKISGTDLIVNVIFILFMTHINNLKCNNINIYSSVSVVILLLAGELICIPLS